MKLNIMREGGWWICIQEGEKPFMTDQVVAIKEHMDGHLEQVLQL